MSRCNFCANATEKIESGNSISPTKSFRALLFELWDKATDEERETLTGLLVEQVEMKDKERGTFRLTF